MTGPTGQVDLSNWKAIVRAITIDPSNLVAISNLYDWCSSQSLVFFSPDQKLPPEVSKRRSVNFLEDGRVMIGRPIPNPSGGFDIVYCKRAIAARNVAISHSSPLVMTLFQP
jgi:hypothetical protein